MASYSVDKSGNIYKDGRYVPAENYKYVEQDPAGQQALAAAKTIKSGGTSASGWSSTSGWVGSSGSGTASGSGTSSSAKSGSATYAPATQITSPPGTFTITDAYGNPVTIPLLSQKQVDTLRTYLSQEGVSHSPDVVWSGPGQLSPLVYTVAGLAQQAQQPRTDPELEAKLAALGAELAAAQEQLAGTQSYYENLLQAINARLQEAAQAMQPVSIQQPPTLQDITPAEDVQAAQPQEQPKSALPTTSGGFVQQASALPFLPSVDKLYDLYKQVFGKEDEEARVYLASPQFQGILSGGAVPMWMQTDPLWRLYLARLGVLRRLGQAQ